MIGLAFRSSVVRWKSYALLFPPLLFAACHAQPSTSGPRLATIPQGSVPGAAPGIHLVSEISNGEWTMAAGDYGKLRSSALDAIKTTNAKDLHVVTTLSTGIPHGHEGQPLVVNNTMYIVTPYPNNLIAVDLTKPGGAMKWAFEPHPDPRSVGIACCDVVNRGAAYADGKIVYSLLDAHTVAVNADTGEEVWRTKVGNIDLGETMTGAPLIVKDKVIVGTSGAEMGVRG